MKGHLQIKKYYFIAGMLLTINIAVFIFFHKDNSPKAAGWHTTIYPLSLLLFRAFAVSILLAFSCYIICLLLEKTKSVTVSALYFILVSLALTLLTIPFLPYKIIGIKEMNPDTAVTIESIASAALYAIILIHLLLMLYFFFPNKKRLSVK